MIKKIKDRIGQYQDCIDGIKKIIESSNIEETKIVGERTILDAKEHVVDLTLTLELAKKVESLEKKIEHNQSCGELVESAKAFQKNPSSIKLTILKGE